MPFKIRRIVTGHDAKGKAVIKEDAVIEAKPGVKVKTVGNAMIWATDSMPVDFANDEATAAAQANLTPGPGGSIFRVLELPPGTEPFMHRTDTIDYVLVLEGEADMLLDEGAEVHMKAGDIMVQRATWHGWANRSDRPVRIAFILIAARPPEGVSRTSTH